MSVLTFMRHAEPDVKPGVFYGFTDCPLTDAGRSHAREAGKTLYGRRFERIIASPLSRAVETMELACGAAGIDCSGYIEDDRLREMNFGLLENYSFEQVERDYPETALAMRNDWLHAKLGGECALEFFQRVGGFCEYARELEGDSLIVCHNGVIRSALIILLGLDSKAFWKLNIDYCKTATVTISHGSAVLTL